MASCSTNTIYAGTRPVVEMTFRDSDDVLGDPTTITVRVLNPDGTVDEYQTPHATITQTATGIWEFQFPSALPAGKHWVNVVGEGAGVDAARDILVQVHGSHVPAA